MIRKLLIGIVVIFSWAVNAQENYPGLYDEMCDQLQAVYCDYVSHASELKLISNTQGIYLGYMMDNALYGWGYYRSSTGAQSFGQYRRGKFVFGLVISDGIARVGGEDNYVVYDLYSGNIKRLHNVEGDVPLSYPYVADADGNSSPFIFKKEIYANGDSFYGEFYNGRRHGYGVYCWQNGDKWYGRYKDGYRNGYGMLVRSDNKIYYGKWLGDSKVE